MKGKSRADQTEASQAWEPPFPIPPDWRWETLEKALTQRKEFILVEDDKLYKRVTVQLHGRGVIPRDEVSGRDVKTKKQQVVRANDFLVAEIDAKMGGFGIVPEKLSGAVVSSHYFTFEVNQGVVLCDYLAALIRMGFITSEILQKVRGSLNYAAIRPRHVLDIRFPYAPLPVQRKLRAKIQTAGGAYRAAKLQLEAIAALPDAFLRQAFAGKLQ